MKDKHGFLKSLIALAEYFRHDFSKPVQRLYLLALERFTDEQLDAALKRCIGECKFFPKVSELIEMIEGSDDTKALMAWASVVDAMRRHGSYESIEFSDGRITAAIKAMGGWLALCACQETELHWREKEFCDLYGSIQAPEHAGYLPGRREMLQPGIEHNRRYIGHHGKNQPQIDGRLKMLAEKIG